MNPLEALDRSVRLTRDLVSDSLSDKEIVDVFQSFRVRCLADRRNLSSHSGQTALITFVSLLARMGVQVDLDVPDVELVGQQQPLNPGSLLGSLLDLGQDLIPGSLVTAGSELPSDATAVFGNSRLGRNVLEGVLGWRLTGTQWHGEVRSLNSDGLEWGYQWPIGGMISATLAATEIYKAIVRRLPLRDEVKAHLVEAPHMVHVGLCPESLSPVPALHLGPLDIISGGAITQALLYALLRLPNIRGEIRLFERDHGDLSNLNRCQLMRRSHVGWPKTEIVNSAVPDNLPVRTIPNRFEAATLQDYLPMAPNVLVGVDHIPSRWLAQQYTAGWLGIGATSHFFVQTSSHDNGEPCAGCLHPRDEQDDGIPLPTISFVSFWAGLALTVRLIRRALGSPYGRGQQDLEMATLRLDQRNALLFRPVARRLSCPVGCVGSM
jgi:hypothetical protein